MRPVVPYENPQGRRVNALAVPGTHQHAPLTWRTASHSWKGEHVLAFLRQSLPGRAGHPRIVVLDNASCHRSRTVRQARQELAECGLWLWYLPPYSPELNDIERTFRTLKHGAMPRAHLHGHRDPDGGRGDRLRTDQGTADTFILSHVKCLGGRTACTAPRTYRSGRTTAAFVRGTPPP